MHLLFSNVNAGSRVCVILLLLAITACGGVGSGGGNSNDSGPGSPPTGDVSVSIAESEVEVATISSALTGVVNVSGGGQASVQGDEETPLLVQAADENGRPVWLAMAYPGEEELLLDGRSTAEALILLVPAVSVIAAENEVLFQQALDSSSAFYSLNSFIESTANWSESDELPDYIGAAYTSVLEQISLDLSSATITAIDSSERLYFASPASIGIEDEDQYLQRFDIVGGIEVAVVNETPGEPYGTFDLRAGDSSLRTKKRWVGVAIGADPKARLASAEGSILPEGYASLAFDKQVDIPNLGAELLDEGRYGAYVYGPSFNGLNSFPAGSIAEQAYKRAFLNTVVFEIALPGMALISGNELAKCISSELRQDGSVALAKILQSQDFIAAMNNSEIQKAADIAKEYLWNEISSGSLISCGLSTTAAFFEGLGWLAGPVRLAIVTYRVGTNGWALATVGRSMSGVDSEEFVYLSNQTEAFVKVYGAAGDSSSFIEIKNYDNTLNPLEDDGYSGGCEESLEQRDYKKYCLAYLFDGQPPYRLNFEVQCIGDGSNNDVGCASASFEILLDIDTPATPVLEYPADADGEVKFFAGFDSAKEYEIEVTGVDAIGAKNVVSLDIQIIAAEPQLVLRKNNTVIPAEAVNNQLVSEVTALDTEVTDLSGWYSTEFELYNAGKGTAYLSTDSPVIADSSNVRLTFPLKEEDLKILPDQRLQFYVSHHPDMPSDETARITFTAAIDLHPRLGAYDLGNPNGYDGEEYDSVVLRVKKESNLTIPLDITYNEPDHYEDLNFGLDIIDTCEADFFFVPATSNIGVPIRHTFLIGEVEYDFPLWDPYEEFPPDTPSGYKYRKVTLLEDPDPDTPIGWLYSEFGEFWVVYEEGSFNADYPAGYFGLPGQEGESLSYNTVITGKILEQSTESYDGEWNPKATPSLLRRVSSVDGRGISFGYEGEQTGRFSEDYLGQIISQSSSFPSYEEFCVRGQAFTISAPE